MTDSVGHALPPKTRIGEYEVVRVLGQGGFGITYLAFDDNLDGAVALKEYFPSQWAERAADGQVRPRSEADRDNFDWGRRRFLDEAQVLHKFRHPNVVRAHRFFEARGAAYIVTEYVEGESLADVLKRRERLRPEEWRPLFDRLLDGLEHVHSHDYLHRDIKPGNIVIRASDAEPVLIDFGSARQATGERTMTQVLTPEYAPLEQHGKRKQGPPSDLYALAAVSYRVLVGELPPAAPDRAEEDTMRPLTDRFSGGDRAWLAALDRCLAVYSRDRPQSVGELREAFQLAAIPDEEVLAYRRRFRRAKSGNGWILQRSLAAPWRWWMVRRWVGRRSTGETAVAVFSPFFGAPGFGSGETARFSIPTGGGVAKHYQWDPLLTDETPLFKTKVKDEDEGFRWLLEREENGAIEAAARKRLMREAREVKPEPPRPPADPTPPPKRRSRAAVVAWTAFSITLAMVVLVAADGC